MIVKALFPQRTLVVRPYSTWRKIFSRKDKPLASEVLTCYLKQTDLPGWTSYFVRYIDVQNDQIAKSQFNWHMGVCNYHVYRTGCFPYIKYHCIRKAPNDFCREDKILRIVKMMNFGIPSITYGLMAYVLIRHKEIVKTPKGNVPIYFLLPENKGSPF